MRDSYSESVLYYNLPMNGSIRYPVFNIKKRRRFWWISQVAAFEIQQAWRLFEQRIRSRKGSRGRSPFLGRVSAMKYTATKYCSELNLFFMAFCHELKPWCPILQIRRSYKISDRGFDDGMPPL